MCKLPNDFLLRLALRLALHDGLTSLQSPVDCYVIPGIVPGKVSSQVGILSADAMLNLKLSHVHCNSLVPCKRVDVQTAVLRKAYTSNCDIINQL